MAVLQTDEAIGKRSVQAEKLSPVVLGRSRDPLVEHRLQLPLGVVSALGDDISQPDFESHHWNSLICIREVFELPLSDTSTVVTVVCK